LGVKASLAERAPKLQSPNMNPARSLLVAAIVALASPAGAVTRGEVTRDPNGVRQSVVRVESSRGELCSGALIAPNLVLTAAHCVIEEASYRVVAVDRNFRPLRLRAIAAAMHPEFVPGTTPRTQPGVDLAILKLERPLGPDFTPLPPRDANRVTAGDMVLLAGYGVVAEGQKKTARTLRQTTLVSLGTMQVMNRVLVVVDHEFRAERPGAGACRGDSGGPILQLESGGYRLLGIVSWSSGALAASELSACGGLTAVTPVADHARWIQEGVASLGEFASVRAPRRRVLEGHWAKR